MDIPFTERRQIENEMIFRRANEKVGIGLDELDANHVDDGNPQLSRDDDSTFMFKCECSYENCTSRIPVKLSIYQKIHLNRDSFIIKTKHRVQAIEKITITEDTYSVVKKNNSTTEPGVELNVIKLP